MGWARGQCKGKDVWVEVDAAGQPAARGGLVGVRYSAGEGAKVYRAGLANVSLSGQPAVDLPPADAAPSEGSVGSRSGTARSGGPAGRGSGFGKAGTRTRAQAAAAAVAASDLLASFPDDAVVAFTDGACHGNPGPAGAGAVVRLPGGRRVEAYRALGQGTNNIGELTAVLLALELLDAEGVDPDARVEILSDSSYSRGVLTQGWKAKANRELIDRVRAALARRPRARVHWVAGHAGIADNERADALAGQGVEESKRSLRTGNR